MLCMLGTHGVPPALLPGLQVEVTVLPPQGEPRKRSVGRRFSSFVTLHRRVRQPRGGGPGSTVHCTATADPVCVCRAATYDA